jgi:hypothetical protein
MNGFNSFFTQSGTVSAGTLADYFKVAPKPTTLLTGIWNYTTGAYIKWGISGTPIAYTTAGNAIQQYITNSVASGDVRNIYSRLYLTGGAGGEAGRFFTTNSAAAGGASSAINGIHSSISHTGSGNCTGLCNAGRFTYHVPSASLTGTNSVIMAEIYADGTASAVGGNLAHMYCDITGNATGLATLQADNDVVWVRFGAGCVHATNGLVDSNLTASTQGGAIRIYIEGVGVRYIPYITGS